LIEEAVRKMNYNMQFSFPQETERMGTGGALSLISSCIHEEYIYLSNADTYFAENPFKIIKEQTISVSSINYFMRDRRAGYGFTKLDANICNQWPDLYQTDSYVYSGISLVKSDIFHSWSSLGLHKVCSFEKDVFTRLKNQASFMSYPFMEIDFGTEVGYRSLQSVFKKKEVV
jgi:hypothetical protein